MLLCERRSRGKIAVDRFHVLCTECGEMIYVGPNRRGGSTDAAFERLCGRQGGVGLRIMVQHSS